MGLFAVYIDMGLSSNSPIVLTVVTSGQSFDRSFSIKVTQIECESLAKGKDFVTFQGTKITYSILAGDGCLQYFTGVSGQMFSWNTPA